MSEENTQGAGGGEESIEDQWSQALEEEKEAKGEAGPATDGNAAVDTAAQGSGAEAQEGTAAPTEKPGPRPVDSQPASFGELTAEKTGDSGNLAMILDIPVTVSVELGRTRMVVNDLLQLGQGSVVELEKLAGEPMEIFVNNKLVARGEAVVVNEKFVVKLTDIVSPTERISKLK